MAELTSMRNIGKELARKLNAVGISTAEQLEELGAREAFVRLKAAYPQVCLVHLYALEGAVSHTEIQHLPEEKKSALKEFKTSLG